MNATVTGGTGFNGFQACVELMTLGHEVDTVDKLGGDGYATVEETAWIAGRLPAFALQPLDDWELMGMDLAKRGIAFVQFDALKAVGESRPHPLIYLDNHISGTIYVLHAVESIKLDPGVFSSSAMVYGQADARTIPETAATKFNIPDGGTRLACGRPIVDEAASDSELQAVTVRYCNRVDARPLGHIDEPRTRIPNNLAPYAVKIATRERGYLQVFGNDYPTHCGAVVRDCIHVNTLDLPRREVRIRIVNRGTGRACSVPEVGNASGRSIPLLHLVPRQNDLTACCADPAFSSDLLGWSALLLPQRMCDDTWHWHVRPSYESAA